ncbi:MAG TPA: hypothetical protein VMV77_05740 [Bacteroidales bacterium]|nr:hypothetical protein [Bacteroidales bacterium]
MKRDHGKEMYMVVDLDGRSVGDDLEGCLMITCSNKSALSKVSKIGYYRLVYVFKRQKRSYLVENGRLILKSEAYCKGSQPGGFREPKQMARNNID